MNVKLKFEIGGNDVEDREANGFCGFGWGTYLAIFPFDIQTDAFFITNKTGLITCWSNDPGEEENELLFRKLIHYAVDTNDSHLPAKELEHELGHERYQDMRIDFEDVQFLDDSGNPISQEELRRVYKSGIDRLLDN